MRSRGTAALGLALLAALYLIGAGRLGVVRWDGLAPQPYRYVSPPPGHVNPGPPTSAKQSVSFVERVSKDTQVYTADLQAQVLFGSGALPADDLGDAIVVTIVPEAPPKLAGLVVDGNAYIITATYSNGQPVPEPWPKASALYLVFPSGNLPAGLYRLENGQATEVSKTVDFPTLTVQGQIDRGGTYAAAGSGAAASGATPAGLGRIAIFGVIVVVGLLLIGFGLLLILRSRRHQADER